MTAPFLFLHIPKTAGTTLNNILDENFTRSRILDLYTEDQHRALKEITYDEIEKHDLVRGHVFIADYADILDGPVPFQVFTYLRDPVERVLSEYRFLKRWPKSHLYTYLNTHDVSLHEYVTSDCRELKHRGRNNMVNSLSGVKAGSEEERVERAWHHLNERFVCFGLLEQFDESLLMLKRVMGLQSVFYEKQNVSAHSVDKPVTKEEFDMICECNQMDLKLYELAVQEFACRVEALGPDFATDVRMFKKVNQRFQRVSELVNQNVGLEQGALINAK